ncbi:MAG: glutamate--tRNA ligase [Spirochaetales bacterium]
MKVRVRYAPSPTGLQHIGGVRTALFNYFFARSSGGTFILRIEDTDRERYDPRALQDIYDTFDWLGIHWDEGPRVGGAYGPYFQSERTKLYQEHAERLVQQNRAYYCFCTPERLEALREEQAQKKEPLGYDRKCRNVSKEEAENRKKKGEPYVIRLKVPLEGTTTFYDRLIGTVTHANKDINPDPVLLKSDGFPTYHLANVVDDHLMEITHILRAQEWIPSCPLHVQLYQAFGWEPPEYCHLPMVMGSDGHKLSKRHGSTSMVEFRNAGYLPEAIINYVSLLGWSYDDSRQLFSKKDLEKLFTLEKLNKAPAVFDYKKLEWFNGHYIRERDTESLKKDLIPFLQKDGILGNPISPEEDRKLTACIPLIKERLRFLTEASQWIRFIFKEVDTYPAEALIPKKSNIEEVRKGLKAIAVSLEDLFQRDIPQQEEFVRKLSEDLGMKLGNLLMPLRVALTGSTVSPPLMESMQILGKEETEKRISKALRLLAA